MKRDLYKHLIESEKDELEAEELIARIEALKAQFRKDTKTTEWLPMATIAPILAALVAATGYIIGKIS